VTGAQKPPATAQLLVPQEIGAQPAPEAPDAPDAVPCAKCGAPRPTTSAGRPRRDSVYCSATCRREATRVRRAAAREEARAAAADFDAAAVRLVVALRTLGVLPSLTRPSPRRRRNEVPR
jgi:hypothetical protein